MANDYASRLGTDITKAWQMLEERFNLNHPNNLQMPVAQEEGIFNCMQLLVTKVKEAEQ